MKKGLDPWRIKSADFPAQGADSEKLQFLVNYAVLAPSKCNGQPWLFEICGDSLDLICDRNWAFRISDPHRRELTISCGAALQNLCVAARHLGQAAVIEPFPQPGDKFLLARMHLEKSRAPEGPTGLAGSRSLSRPARSGSEKSRVGTFRPVSNEELFEAMKNRSTDRRPFWNGAPPEEVLEACRLAAFREGAWLHVIKGAPGRSAMADLVARGVREQMADRSYRREFAKWFHLVRGKSKDGLPGSAYGLRGPFHLLSPALSLLLWSLNPAGPLAAQKRRLAARSPVLAVLGTAEDSPAAWLAAGQGLQAVLLHATALGLAASFLNQPIEVEHLRNEVRELTGQPGFPQLLLRLGYGTSHRHTPRRPAKDVVI